MDMKYTENGVSGIRIAYIGGGSRGWAWGLMSDLVSASDISGEVCLYDIDRPAAEANKIIGNGYNSADGAKSHWDYSVSDTLGGALDGADFVVISILPATFTEMQSDVHAPEKFGIYQSVGDTTGPGGIIRALRELPMICEITQAIKQHCPDAWVINYTNPMTVTVAMMYRVFPQIHAYGCCHEVAGTARLLAEIVADKFGGDPSRHDIMISVTGINHFTWITRARYHDIDLYPIYREYAEKYAETGYTKGKDPNWRQNPFDFAHRVKFDLFNKYGCIAAAGDRHLAEFCDGDIYLGSRENAQSWGFDLTPVSYRIDQLNERLEHSRLRVSGEEKLVIRKTGEEGVDQMRAILGLHTLVTNVNMPNIGQVPELPIGAVVETNAAFTAGDVSPVVSHLPDSIFQPVNRIVGIQQMIVDAAYDRDLDAAFEAFCLDPLVRIDRADARKLFDEMVYNTREYLKDYGM